MAKPRKTKKTNAKKKSSMAMASKKKNVCEFC